MFLKCKKQKRHCRILTFLIRVFSLAAKGSQWIAGLKHESFNADNLQASDMIWCHMICDIDMIYWYDILIWCDMIYMIWYDMMWYDVLGYMMWYDMIWYVIWYDIWCDMIWCHMICDIDMIYDMMWYDIWYEMMWYDVIWYMW